MKKIVTVMQAATNAGVATLPVMPADKSMPSGINTDTIRTFTTQVAAPGPFFG